MVAWMLALPAAVLRNVSMWSTSVPRLVYMHVHGIVMLAPIDKTTSTNGYATA